MAVMDISFYANSLMRNVMISVILPTDKKTGLGQEEAPPKFPVLYLLHGIFGNHRSWINGSSVQPLADAYNVCIVMPSGENRFYCDSSKTGDYFGTFISEELPQFIGRTFPVYTDREHTFLAGLSMGGFGTAVNGLKHPETFSRLGIFSAALIKDRILTSRNENVQDYLTKKNYETIFDLDDVKDFEGSVNDYDALAERLTENRPQIWMACGNEDFLYDVNAAYAEKLKKLGYDIVWQHWPGKHDWTFWQECIEQFIPWLLNADEAGEQSASAGI